MGNILTDLFTGAPVKEAAAAQQGMLKFVADRGRGDITGAAGQAQDALQSGYGAAQGSLGTGYNTGVGAINTGADQALGYLSGSTTDALGRLDSARGAYEPLSALAGKYGGATTMGLNALGVNGQGGIDAARGAFQAGPAYDWNLNQGLEAINRRRAAGGMLASGNADRDAQNYGAGLASNEYDKWLQQLLGFTNPELSATGGAATGRAGADTNAAALLAGQGRAQAGVAGTRGQMLADLAGRYGTGMAGLNTGEGTSLANLYTNAANQRVGLDTNLVQPYNKTFTDVANAEIGGAKNLWGLGLEAAKLGAAAAGGGWLGNLTPPAPGKDYAGLGGWA